MSGFDKDNSEKTHEQQVTDCRQVEICYHGILLHIILSCAVTPKTKMGNKWVTTKAMDNGVEHTVLTDNPKVALLKVYTSALERISAGAYLMASSTKQVWDCARTVVDSCSQLPQKEMSIRHGIVARRFRV